MRIAINGWFLSRPGTGSGQYLRELLRALSSRAADHELALVVPRSRFELGSMDLDLQLLALPSRLTQGNLGKVWFEQIAFPSACRRLGADVAHVPYWGSPLRSPAPVVVTVHDLIPLLLPEYRGGPLVRLYTRLVATAARRAALVLTDSLASKADIETHLRVPPERVRSIYLAAAGSFTPEPAPDDGAVRARYGLPPRYLLYLAGHDVRKNVQGLVRAFAEVARADDDVTLVIGGELPDPPRRGLWATSSLYDPRPLVESLDLQERVRFLGVVADRDRPALYRGAACAAFLSRCEGFGLPVLEALSSATPLVASNSSSIPELMGDAGFAVDPDDTREIAAAILSCLVDEALASELRSRGPRQAARFRWSDAVRETLEAYSAAASLAR
ncbi:MAG TPA: glycosyltransferase family 1 protein [Anaerolineae bacterium]|nr:glycosyltransferase family 1 protein [Anaerolineae bacterium]